jgi:hypothetical protein
MLWRVRAGICRSSGKVRQYCLECFLHALCVGRGQLVLLRKGTECPKRRVVAGTKAVEIGDKSIAQSGRLFRVKRQLAGL